MTVSAPQAKRAIELPQDSELRPKRKDIKSLTSLRFLCAASVIIFHAKDCYRGFNEYATSVVIEHTLCFFFVLSGFVLTLNYHNLNETKGAGKFYLARFGRVWPAHMITLCMLVLLIPEAFRINSGNFGLFAGNLMLIHAWLPDWRTYFSFNAPTWSNSTEIFFYLSFPFLLLALKKRWYLALAPAAALLVGMVSYCNYNQFPNFSYGPCNLALIYIHPFSRIFEFVIGMCAAKLFMTQVSSWRINWWAATFFEMALFALAYHVNVNSPSISLALKPWVGGAGAYWLQNSGLPVLIMASLFLILSTEKGAFSRLLSYRPLVFLGEISFSAYMLHSVILTFRNLNFPHASSATDCALFVAILLIGSHLMSETLERPIRDWIMKLGSLLNKQEQNPPISISKSVSKKKRIFLALEACALALLIYTALPGAEPVTKAELNKLTTEAAVKDINFAPAVKLLAARAVKTDGSIQVTMVWESLKDQKLDILDIVDVLDHNGKVLSSTSHMQDMRFTRARSGTLWKETFTVSGSDCSTAANVSVRLLKSKRKPLTCMQNGVSSAAILIPCKDKELI